MKITNEILRNSFLCDFKVKHLFRNDVPKKGVIKWIEYLRYKIEKDYIKERKIQIKELKLSDQSKVSLSNLSGFYRICYDSCAFELSYPLVELILQKNNRLKLKIYFFSSKDKITKRDVAYSREMSSILADRLDLKDVYYSIIFSHDRKIKNLRITKGRKKNDMTHKIRNWVEDDSICPTRLPHCSVCELNDYCSKALKEQDNLKLLGRISDKEVNKLKSKGIFTINQLSYTFKPRRRKRQSVSKGRYLYELKALALRDSKTYVLNKKEIPNAETEIYIDFEGNLQHSIYLIGAVLKKGNHITKHIFWSDKVDDQEAFLSFFNWIFDLTGNYFLYHYGSYELKAIKKINKKHLLIDDEKLSFLENRMINLLDYFYSDIFPPTYSNGLKEISKYLGFDWSSKNANGIQSTYWRSDWLLNRSEKIKRKILTYNIEDCLALIKIKDWLSDVSIGDKRLKDVISDTKRHHKTNSSLKYGNPSFLIDEFQKVNKLAYFNYQREKVIIRDKEFKKEYSPRVLSPKFKNRINSHEYPSPPLYCSRCGSYKLNTHQNSPRKIIDLKISSTGIKKNCTVFHGQRFRCEECKYVFTPKSYARQPKYGYYLRLWIINHVISYRMSYGNVRKMLNEYFQISISIAYIVEVRSEFARLYLSLFEELKESLIKGNLIQGDETKINLRQESGYIWVITNLSTVIYFYQPNREGKFLQDILEDFDGVIVSDFYAAYDSIGCDQQKCLIHLIRDINDDLFQNQTNEDLQFIAQKFGILIRKIVSTVDKYGLKRRNLNKHNKDVKKFYKNLRSREIHTELGNKWLKRFSRNEKKLFTFLNYDGIPWNNNNAEHAVKSFALHRKEINGLYNKKGMTEFLILLSISETCKFRGISFWEFLKAKKMTLN